MGMYGGGPLKLPLGKMVAHLLPQNNADSKE